MLNVRRSRLTGFFEQSDLDAILFTDLLNIRYLSGFSGSDGALLLARDGRCWFLCDSRYTSQAAVEVREADVRQYAVLLESVAELVSEQKFVRIGIEAANMTVAAYNALDKRLNRSCLVMLGPALDRIRSVKDSDEIDRLAQVAGLASSALQSTLPLIRPGVAESEIARELEFEMRRRGADARAFDFIVASGERGAMPHGRASNRLLGSGELVTIDFGAVLGGYHSDETVTVAVGGVDGRLKELHDVVLSAHDKAIAAVRPGISCKELDSVARDHIVSCGFGEFFGHGLGHGVGLAIHEKPTLSPRSEDVIEQGMVFTIEPGIYIPDLGGVRIEDTVVVTEAGCRVLTGAPKQMQVV